MTATRTLPAAGAFTLALLGLAACASAPDNPAREARTPGALYALEAEPASDRIALAMHAEGLSPAQAEALRALARRRLEADGGPVTIEAPRGADPALAARAAEAARALLLAEGVPAEAVRLGVYDAAEPGAPLKVGFPYDRPVVHACGRDWDELTHTRDNRVQPNFGCAVTANMAAQIAHPADLGGPQAEQPGDVGRRLDALAKYREGKTTAADESQAQARGGVVARMAP